MAYSPFTGRILNTPPPMRVLHRFTKSGRVAEILERKVTQFRAIDFFVFLDGLLLESQIFHGAREVEYPLALASRIAQLIEDGWIEELRRDSPSQ